MFVLVADVSYGIATAEERLQYWLTFLSMATGRLAAGTAIDVLLVASHTDKTTDVTPHDLRDLSRRLDARFSERGIRVHPDVFAPHYHEPAGGPGLHALCQHLDAFAADDTRSAPFPEP